MRRAIDAAGHPALLLVDSISGLACADLRHDEWGIDVTIGGSQKGLMLPPGIGFNAVSPRALEAAKTAKLPRAFWGWDEIIAMNADGYWPTTPNTNLLYALNEALEMLLGEGLDNVFARHQRWAEGVRAAVEAWRLPIQCAEPAQHSPVLTGVMMPAGVDADAVRRLIYERFDLSLGTGLGKVKGRMFRIGHLGDSNDLTLLAALAGCEMGLKLAGVRLAGERRAGGDGRTSPAIRRAPASPPRHSGRGARRPRSPVPIALSIAHCSHTLTRSSTMQRRTLLQAAGAAAAALAAPRLVAQRMAERARCASSSAFRRAAEPMRWRASSPPS